MFWSSLLGTLWAAFESVWGCPQACLEHRHSFVRRNAVLAINALYKLPKGELLLQDAPELIEKVLQVGAGSSTLALLWNLHIV